MNLSGKILKAFGWSVDITVPDFPKAIICVAPHTSNWDFIIGKLAYASVGRRAGFLMKETWFFWPLKYFFRSIGGIAVPRRRGSSLSETIIRKFKEADRLTLAITPEGTRSLTREWRTGFLHIAEATGVPVCLGVLDYGHKRVIIKDYVYASGDNAADLRRIKDYYKGYQGRYPEKFSAE